MAEYAGFLRDLETGAIIGVQRKSTLIEYENQNKDLMKSGDKHLIRFEVMNYSEGIEEFNKKAFGISTTEEEIKETEKDEKIIKKSGRPAKS